MADYISTQNGNWNDDSTWGGSGHPSADSDTFTIGHKVNYDLGDSTVKFGNGSINDGGMLIFPSSSDSTIYFQDGAILTINSGGEIRTGTSATIEEIAASNHCRLHWEQGTALRYVFVVNDGAKVNMRGGTDYYSGIKKLTLESDWDASSGDTFYVEGDQTTTWPVGAKIYINKGYASGASAPLNAYYNDAGCFEIASIGSYDAVNNRTPIIVVAGHGNTNTYLAGQKVLILSRNLEFADPNTSWVIHDYGTYSEMLRFDFNQGISNRLVDIRDALWLGWDYALLGGYNFKARNCIYYACNNGLGQCYNAEVLDSYFLSSHYAMNTIYSCHITGGAYNNHYGSHGVNNSLLEMEFMSNNVSCDGNKCVTIIGDMKSSNHAVYNSSDIVVIGNIRQNNNAVLNADKVTIMGDLVDNLSNIDVDSDTQKYSVVVHGAIDGDFREFWRFQSGGNSKVITSSDSEWASPPSGNSSEFLFEPNANCGSGSWFNDVEVWRHPVYLTASDASVAVSVRPHGYSTPIADDELWVEVRYYGSADSGKPTIVNSKGDGTTSYNNDSWHSLSVNVSPARDQLAEVIVYCGKYESGANLIIDMGNL